MGYKQVIIIRKDLQMSPGKLAAQVSHASMAFLTNAIKKNVRKVLNEEYQWFSSVTHEIDISQGNISIDKDKAVQQHYKRADLEMWASEAFEKGQAGFYTKTKHGNEVNLELCDNPEFHYEANIVIDEDLFEKWILGAFTKVTLGARNKNQLLKAVEMAKELGMKEGVDYFLIKDNCYTELEPEEVDENGIGRTLTCVGFKPMDAEVIDQIGKKYHLYV